MDALRSVLLLIVLGAPLATALPLDVHGADLCALAGGASACTSAMMAGSEASLGYTQQELACGGSECVYRPTARLSLATTVPGDWILRAQTWSTHHPSNQVFGGSHREMTCRVSDPSAPCEVAETTRDVVGNPFNSAKWHGAWTLSYVDALGAEHVQAAWSGSGWLAQYCNCPG